MTDVADNNRDFAAAIRSGDPLAASQAYAEDALLQPPNTAAVEGRDQIAAFWRAGLDAGVTDVELVPLRERRNDGIAFEIGTYTMHVDVPEGGTVVDRGRYLIVHKRDSDGSWRYAAEMFTPDLPPGVDRP